MALQLYSTLDEKLEHLSENYNAIDSDTNKSYFNKYFMPVDDDNNFRPFGEGLVEHPANTATIVLTQLPKGEISEDTLGAVKDYYKDFSAVIKQASGAPPIGSSIPTLTKLGPKYIGVFKNFSILGVTETRAEISKISFNFGNKWNAFFFGQQPKVYVFSGLFLDSMNYPYYEEFMRAYDEYLAGGRCIEKGFKLYMSYDGKIISGWMLGVDTTSRASDVHTKGFSFRMLVADEDYYRVNNHYDIDGNFVDISIAQLSNVHQVSNRVINRELN